MVFVSQPLKFDGSFPGVGKSGYVAFYVLVGACTLRGLMDHGIIFGCKRFVQTFAQVDSVALLLLEVMAKGNIFVS